MIVPAQTSLRLTNYESVLAAALPAARALLARNLNVESECAKWTVRKMRAFALNAKDPAGEVEPNPVIAEVCDLITEFWEPFVRGDVTGRDFFRTRPGLWARWMREAPLGDYGRLLANYVNERYDSNSSLLELGAGVGNTSLHVNPTVDYVRTDLEPIVKRDHLGTESSLFDFDNSPIPDEWLDRFDVIFATNAIHCSANPTRVFERLLPCLKSGGEFVIAEGAPMVREWPNPPGYYRGAEPWALTWICGVMPAWVNCDGFSPRDAWATALDLAGYTRLNSVALKSECGIYDLGGLVRGEKD